jgi:hypothetical protein
MPLGGRSLPVLEGTRIRTGAGGASVDLVDGTRIGVLPFSMTAIRAVDGHLEVTLERGRLAFRLPATARAVIRTPAARLTPRRGEAAAGEVVAGATTGVRLASGRVEVMDFAAGSRIVAPDGLPKEPPRQTRPGRLVFGPRGDSVGYLEDARTLVVHPGFAADLTAPFPAKTVRRAVAAIPPARQPEATPLFDVAGAAVGYVAGPGFFPMTAQASGGPVFVETLPDEGWPWYYYAAAGVAAGGLGVGIAVAVSGGGDSDPPASPVSP